MSRPNQHTDNKRARWAKLEAELQARRRIAEHRMRGIPTDLEGYPLGYRKPKPPPPPPMPPAPYRGEHPTYRRRGCAWVLQVKPLAFCQSWAVSRRWCQKHSHHVTKVDTWQEERDFWLLNGRLRARDRSGHIRRPGSGKFLARPDRTGGERRKSTGPTLVHGLLVLNRFDTALGNLHWNDGAAFTPDTSPRESTSRRNSKSTGKP